MIVLILALGLVSAPSWTITSTRAAEPPSAHDIPERTWVLLPLPPQHGSPSAANKTPAAGLANHDKHVSLAWNPDNRKIYFVGGDYFGLSYRQETWSLDVKVRLSAGNPAAGWTLEYPFCGPSTQVQPKGPDFVGWTWDPSRHVFWMVPGEMAPHGAWSGMLCPGEVSDSYTSNGNLLFKHIMQFDPVTQKWADYDSWNGSETWFAVYDPKTDTIIHDARDSKMGVYDIKTKTWKTYSYSNQSGPGLQISKTIWAADLTGRRIFMPESLGRLYRWDMDTRNLILVGPSPCGPAPAADRAYAVWDSNAKVMIQSCYGGGVVYAYHPDETPPRWEDLSKLPIRGALNPKLGSANGVQFNGVTFDPVNNWLVGLGWQGIWLFRYGAVTRSPVPAPKQ